MTTTVVTSAARQDLALLGGPKTVEKEHPELFRWPIVTKEDERAVLEVLRAGSMSKWDITRQFEQEYAAWQQRKFGLASANGTMALLTAMHAVGVRRGDEIIAPSITYWASALPAFGLGATVVFADIDPESMCIDPKDIEHRITPRTKAIVPVHYCGHPCDMDPIMEIARKHSLKVVEDVSHAHGALYKGRMVGTFGDAACASMMAGKSFPVGEGGIMCTDDREIYERSIAFANYERHDELTIPAIKEYAGLPLGGVKGRMNQTCSAMGRVQLKHYPQRMAEIQKAMNRFWDLLKGVPGVRAHRPAKDSGSTMGGWYNPLGHYFPEELGGLRVEKFIEALLAEGVPVCRGCNFPLHLHPVFNNADVYGDGKPTRIAFSDRDLRQPTGSLPHAEAAQARTFGIPWFKHDRPSLIRQYAKAFKKVAAQAHKLTGQAT